MSTHLPDELRARIEDADRQRCCYCLTSEANSGNPLTLVRIRPASKGGESAFENLCLACRTCNEFKSASTAATDPLTGDDVPLFNPRAQKWAEHFEWSLDSTRVAGLTPAGRATVIVLRMNNPAIIAARRRWTHAAWHPPTPDA